MPDGMPAKLTLPHSEGPTDDEQELARRLVHRLVDDPEQRVVILRALDLEESRV